VFLYPNSQPVDAINQCQTDADCVPATCCHPTDAVNKAYDPDCSGIACTENCEPNTIDCGQGYIACVDNTCTAVIVQTVDNPFVQA